MGKPVVVDNGARGLEIVLRFTTKGSKWVVRRLGYANEKFGSYERDYSLMPRDDVARVALKAAEDNDLRWLLDAKNVVLVGDGDTYYVVSVPEEACDEPKG